MRPPRVVPRCQRSDVARGRPPALARSWPRLKGINAFERRGEARLAGDEADAPMAKGGDMIDQRRATAGGIVDPDLVEPLVGQPVDQHAGQAFFEQDSRR